MRKSLTRNTRHTKNWEIFLIQKIKTFPIKECCVCCFTCKFGNLLLLLSPRLFSLLFSPSVNFSLRYTVSNTRIIEMEKEKKVGKKLEKHFFISICPVTLLLGGECECVTEACIRFRADVKWLFEGWKFLYAVYKWNVQQ